MKIPKSFQFFGQTIVVEYDTNLSYRTDDKGQFHGRLNLIKLQPIVEGFNCPKENVEATFCHEVVHVWLEKFAKKEVADDEKLVELIGLALHQFLTSMEYPIE